METYTILREFADSWFLLAMFGFFLATAIWAFLPSQKASRERAAAIPFLDEGGKGNADGSAHRPEGANSDPEADNG